MSTRAALRMSETQWQGLVIDYAHHYGWIVAHFRPMQRADGSWRTPVEADGVGFPDLVLAHAKAHRVIFAELKSNAGKVSPEQQVWLDALEPDPWEDCTLLVQVWRPRDEERVKAILAGAEGRL